MPQVTSLISVGQPAPETWKLFSHSILLKSGRTVYCGPAEQALRGVTRCVSVSVSFLGCLLFFFLITRFSEALWSAFFRKDLLRRRAGEDVALFACVIFADNQRGGCARSRSTLRFASDPYQRYFCSLEVFFCAQFCAQLLAFFFFFFRVRAQKGPNGRVHARAPRCSDKCSFRTRSPVTPPSTSPLPSGAHPP